MTELAPTASKPRPKHRSTAQERDRKIDGRHDLAVVVSVVVADRTIESGFPVEREEHQWSVVVMDGYVHGGVEHAARCKGDKPIALRELADGCETGENNRAVQAVVNRNPRRVVEKQVVERMLHRLLKGHTANEREEDASSRAKCIEPDVGCETASHKPPRCRAVEYVGRAPLLSDGDERVGYDVSGGDHPDTDRSGATSDPWARRSRFSQ